MFLLPLLLVLSLSVVVGVLLSRSLQGRQQPLPSLLVPRSAPTAVWRLGQKVLVPQTVDAALQRLLERVLLRYLSVWTRDVSADPAFLHEVRELVRCACAELLRRASSVDLAALILGRLIPAGVCHVDCCLLARRLHRSGSLSDQAAWDYYGRQAHSAVWAEARYLRALSGRLVPLLLATRPLNSAAGSRLTRELLANALLQPLLELVANPDTVNQLLLELFSAEPLEPCPVDCSPRVELLRAWSLSARPTAGGSLATDLSGVLKSADLLYALMQCLKERRALHLVQFCLAVEAFNQRMLNPELSEEQLRTLYTEASHIYNAYMRPESSDFVGVDDVVCDQVRDVLCGPVEGVTRLRRMKALFEAYEQAYNRLEQEYMTDFLCSRHYLTQLCRRQTAGEPGCGRQRAALRSVRAVARWSRRLR